MRGGGRVQLAGSTCMKKSMNNYEFVDGTLRNVQPQWLKCQLTSSVLQPVRRTKPLISMLCLALCVHLSLFSINSF